VKSTDIAQLSAWESWPHPALTRAPETPGVYVFRLSKCFGRMQGESDIVYIGLAKKNIKGRIGRHRYTAIGLVLKIFRNVGTLQVAWKSCSRQSDAMSLESTLLGRYAREHIELPPSNRQQSLKDLQQLFKALGKLGNVEVNDQLEERVLAALPQLEAPRPKPNP
jgi:hypothetical protein